MSVKRWKLGWKRCDCVKCEAALTIEQTEENCGWVKWEDHKDEVARLKAEVERLRKAGDAMKDAVETYFELMPMLVNEVRAKAMLKGRKAIKDWNAAKEGKQSV